MRSDSIRACGRHERASHAAPHRSVITRAHARLCRTAVPAVLTAALLAAAAPVWAGGKVMVGFLNREARQYRAEWRDYRYRRELVKHAMDGSLVENRPMYRGAMNPEAFHKSLKPFNVVVLVTSTEGVYQFDNVKANCAGARMALERSVREGGGLFVLLQPHRYPNSDDETYFNALLEGFGCRFLHEGTYDPAHTFQSPKTLTLPAWEYFLTTSFADHPITQGIDRLYLPRFLFRRPGVAAFKLEGPWKAVVRGEATAKSYVQNQADNLPDWSKVGTYASAPPIAAARQFGKGRVFIYAAPNLHVFGNMGNPLWPHIVETDGDAENSRPSHGNRLVINALRWLGEPSLGIPDLGTYRDEPPKPVTYPKAVNWDKYRFAPVAPDVQPDKYGDGVAIRFPESAVGVKGIIGAHTALTDGKGTVADYVAAAKAAGLKFLVFTEPLELLTPEELGRLRDVCAAASKGQDFVACPGVEFTDVLGNRWAAWGQKVIYPPADFEYRGRKHSLWDGKRIGLTGQYELLCAFRPNALIDYKTLARAPADRTNMWWFFRLFPFAYDGTTLIADNVDEWLFALRDLRWMDLASFTRVRSPAEVAKAAATCMTVVRSVQQARKWLDTRCSSYNHAARPYVTQGPLILFWEGLNTQMEQPVQITRGIQRVRLRFDVASDAGIREVKVHDANFGVVRRFLGRGAKRVTRDFEMVHDRQHFLTLEVVDTKGRRAISRYILLFCYKSGLYRCGDNLNTLSSSAITWHPERAEMPLVKHHEDIGRLSVAGFDTSSGVAPQPRVWHDDYTLLRDKPGRFPTREQGALNKILDVKLTSHDLQIVSFTMDHFIERWDNEKRPGPALSSIPRRVGPADVYEHRRTSTVLRSRLDYFTTWNHRRVFEGSRNYRGGIVWHEGSIRFKKDVTLRGHVPITLLILDGPGGAPFRQFDHLFVTDRDRGTLAIALRPQDKVHRMHGRIAPGGYLAAMPTDVGYYAFFASSESDFAYDSQEWDKKLAKFGRIYIGLGRDGQAIKAGTVLRYRFLIATLNDRRVSNELLEDMRRAYNLDGGRGGYPLALKHGKLLDAQFFLTLQAEGNEVLFDAGPRAMICDLPIRVRGVEDNGCAAVYSSRGKFFRFIAVADGAACFQEPIDKAVTLWVGNVFAAKDKRLKLTLVRHGQAPGKPPFLEVHNPTDEAIRSAITSPAHAPLFGGFQRTVEVPAGSSIRVTGLGL